MTTLYDVPAEDLVEALAGELADDLEEPDWATYVTTGTGRELPPEQEDFWARRGASLLRRVAVDGPIGVERLTTYYGSTEQGSNRFVVRPNHSSDGAGKIIRTLLQQLEEAGYVKIAEGEGRQVTGEGRSMLDDVAEDVIDDLDRPELERYA